MAAEIWGIEDWSTGVAGLVRGSFAKAQREAMQLSEHKGVIVTIYEIKAGRWTPRAMVKPDPPAGR